jgi:EpsD family peptidyl-prolyl cis-trans isomerase
MGLAVSISLSGGHLSQSNLKANHRIRFVTALSLGALTLLAGCPLDKSAKNDVSQVAATVNGEELSIHQVRAYLSAQPTLASQGAQAAQLALSALLDQELAAQAASSDGLDKSPEVIQALELAKREVLARAYQNQIWGKLTQPDSETLDRYYDQHPELFAQRKRYTLQEVTVKGDEAVISALKAKVEQQASADAVKASVSATGLPMESRNFTFWAENLPMDLLPKLAFLKDGQSIAIVQAGGQGLAVVTVLGTELQPLSRSQADASIRGALMSQARTEAMRKAMDGLKQKGKIVLNPPFSASGAAPASPVDPAATAASVAAAAAASAAASAPNGASAP